jgi:hypothetical protein
MLGGLLKLYNNLHSSSIFRNYVSFNLVNRGYTFKKGKMVIFSLVLDMAFLGLINFSFDINGSLKLYFL